MPTALRLFGNRDLAALYRGEAKRLLWVLKNRLELASFPQGRMVRTYPDGTAISVEVCFGNQVILIESPFPPSPEEKVQEILYYLRLAYLHSLLVPEHDYLFCRIQGRGMPSAILQEIPVSGTESRYIQAPYFKRNNRKHKRTPGGEIVLLPSLGNESFNEGTVAVPHETADWDPYETDDHFQQWHETVSIQVFDLRTEDLSLWDVPSGTGTRGYTATNIYKLTYEDASGSHTITDYIVSPQIGTLTRHHVFSGDGFFFLSSSFSADQTANRPVKDTSPPYAIGNLLTWRVARNLASVSSGSLAADWIFSSFDPVLLRNYYSIEWTGSQTRSISGRIVLDFGEVEVESAEIAVTDNDAVADTTSGFAPTDAGGNVNGTALFDLPEMTKNYSRDESVFTVLEWANVEDEVFALIYRKTRYSESYGTTDILYSNYAMLQLFQPDGDITRYMQRCEFPPYPAPTGSHTHTKTDTMEYYLAYKTQTGGLQKILLATGTREGADTNIYSGQYVSHAAVNVNKFFILYSYKIFDYPGDTLNSVRYGVIKIDTGERREFSFTPAEYMGGNPPSIYMYVPREKEKQL
jgi:hypothetical protein